MEYERILGGGFQNTLGKSHLLIPIGRWWIFWWKPQVELIPNPDSIYIFVTTIHTSWLSPNYKYPPLTFTKQFYYSGSPSLGGPSELGLCGLVWGACAGAVNISLE